MADTLLAAWQEAADDLGIRVERCGDEVLVKDFGGPGGMLCALTGEGRDPRDLVRKAEALGCGWSELSRFYLDYERGEYIDMLNDWQWTGEGEPPPWYTGEPWTE